MHNLYIESVSGEDSTQPFQISETLKYPTGWSPDGRAILFHQNGGPSGWDVMIAQSELGSSPVPFAQSPFNEMQAQVSPDGRWVAYTSDESKQHEIYVRRRDGHCDRLHVSANGGSSPRCNPRGAELFCVSLDGYLNAVLVTLRAERLEASPARPLFKVPEAMTRSPFVSLYDVAPDGQRFLTRVPERMCARCR